MKKGKSVSPVMATVIILVVVLVVALLWMKFSAPSNPGGSDGMGMSMGNADLSKMTPELSKSISENLSAAAKKNAGAKQ